MKFLAAPFWFLFLFLAFMSYYIFVYPLLFMAGFLLFF